MIPSDGYQQTVVIGAVRFLAMESILNSVGNRSQFKREWFSNLAQLGGLWNELSLVWDGIVA
ncbi:TPA: hypothetical protein EYO63_26580 [Candidatus Poribacteria bacterium]|jgi:hypothetical protein|nr:hypothetical protein [Candidatus Poribacteria bacterium]